ncbi:MAG: phosphatase PAP2 family protein [Acidobacteriia bacterium]|nr:phosphatase PAP2 family protein [Terriglobia bacterium]
MILERLLPPDDDRRPDNRDRIRFLLVAIVPWIVLYEVTAHLHLPGRAFQFGFEGRLPIWSWTAVFYQSIYPAVALAPWFARTRRDLRRFTISSWLAMAVVFPFYWIIPSTAPRRPLEISNPVARLLAWERNTYPPTAAFPSFHVLWVIFVARIYRPAWLAALYAAAVTVSCITTGMHYIPDVLASLALAPLLVAPQRIWTVAKRALSLPGSACQPAPDCQSALPRTTSGFSASTPRHP